MANLQINFKEKDKLLGTSVVVAISWKNLFNILKKDKNINIKEVDEVRGISVTEHGISFFLE